MTSSIKTKIMAHRGGPWGPENSISAFKGCIEHQVDGVEFDVWISSDGVPMVLHGGVDGQLALYNLPDELVFEWSSTRLQSEI